MGVKDFFVIHHKIVYKFSKRTWLLGIQSSISHGMILQSFAVNLPYSDHKGILKPADAFDESSNLSDWLINPPPLYETSEFWFQLLHVGNK